MKLSNARYPAESFTCDTCSVWWSFFTPIHFPWGVNDSISTCVLFLHYFYEHPLEGWTLHEDKSCQVPQKCPAAQELLVGDHDLWLWWERHVHRYWQENGGVGELELSEDWKENAPQLWTKQIILCHRIDWALAQSDSRASWTFCCQHLCLSDGISVAPRNIMFSEIVVLVLKGWFCCYYNWFKLALLFEKIPKRKQEKGEPGTILPQSFFNLQRCTGLKTVEMFEFVAFLGVFLKKGLQGTSTFLGSLLAKGHNIDAVTLSPFWSITASPKVISMTIFPTDFYV